MLAENLCDLFPKSWELAVGMSDLLQIDPVIGVDQHIAQTGHDSTGRESKGTINCGQNIQQRLMVSFVYQSAIACVSTCGWNSGLRLRP